MMQILEIVLYDKTLTKKRTLKLEPGKVNIITGKSATGKSTIIDIIDYCLCSSECNVSKKLKKHISWFGLKLSFGNEVIFVARQNPDFLNINKVTDAYISEGDSPDFPPNNTNISVDDLKFNLSLKLGINKGRFIPNKKQNRVEFNISIRNCLDYCFQQQEIISNKKALFESVNDNFKKNDLKNTFPYFLGAVAENKLDLIKQKEDLLKKLKNLQRVYDENQKIIGSGFSRGISLIVECINVGILSKDIEMPRELETIKKILKDAANIEPNFNYNNNVSELLNPLYCEANVLKQQIKLLNAEIESINSRINIFDQYNEERVYQSLHLKPINLYDENEKQHICPLCNSLIGNIPQVKEIKSEFEYISSSLENVTTTFPKLDAHKKRLENEKLDAQASLKEVNNKILALQKQEQKFEEIKALENRYLVTIGRISLWLESFDILDQKDDLLEQINELTYQIEKIENKLNNDNEIERFYSILNKINIEMTEQNKNIETNIEHKNDTLRYNEKQVCVMIYDDDKEEFYKATEAGSAENHLYFHLITLFAFHKHFIKHKRPVPNFLVLDQPTQVYFPEDDKDNNYIETGIPTKNEDRQSVINLFNYLFNFVEQFNGSFQMIITAHANIKTDARFQKYVNEVWRDNVALVPYEWMQ